MALPDFFVAGAPKAGTTALHAALARHPALHMSAVKEPKFFLTDGPPPAQGGPGDAKTYREHVWRRADYEALFAAAPPGTLRGESTPFYLYSHDAQRRIRGARPARQAHRRATRPGRARALELDPPVVGRARPDRRLRPGMRGRGRADRGRLGGLLALQAARPVRAAGAAPVLGRSRASRSWSSATAT